jgi:hypothetical protein
MPILLQDLIHQLPPDTEERVRKARDRFNGRLRDALRRETRLSFHRDDANINVPVQLLGGLPEPLQPRDKQLVPDQFKIALLLSPFRNDLVALRQGGANVLAGLFKAISLDDQTADLRGGESSVRTAVEWAGHLLSILDQFRLSAQILSVNSDVLGVYRYKVRKPDYPDEPEPHIELYWGVIGLVARDIGVSLEDLTAVVLAHELAHAYTHVGSDADDHWWRTRSFQAAADDLKEGLAQFYGLMACKRLDEASPGPVAAFQELLKHQPAAYTMHKKWESYSPERIRLAMLRIRRSATEAYASVFGMLLDQE